MANAVRCPSLKQIFFGAFANSKRRRRPEPPRRARPAFEELESRIMPSVSPIGLEVETRPDTAPLTAAIIDRPLLVLPGIVGTFAYDNPATEADEVDRWYGERGIAPEHLQVDPLAKFYHDIIKTMRNVGYTLDQNLFVANYDWRMDVGPQDGSFDGHLAGLSADSITDATYDYGVDYLGYWLDYASDRWAANHDGERPESVDIVSHSTGGLVARAYIQSDAYGGHVSHGDYDLPIINDFVMVGVPNQGASKAWNMLQDDWDLETGFRIVLSKIVDEAYERILAGGFISGPDYDIVWDGDGDGVADADDADSTDNLIVENHQQFIQAFVPTARSLLATYNFLDRANDDPDGGYLSVNGIDDERNSIVLDLNDGLGLDFQLADLTGPNHGFMPDTSAAQAELAALMDNGPPVPEELAAWQLQIDQLQAQIDAARERVPNAFIDALAGDAIVVYTANARDKDENVKETPTFTVEHLGTSGGAASGPLANMLLPFDEFLSNHPTLADVPWYEEISTADDGDDANGLEGGDGTVPTVSSSGQFRGDPRSAAGGKLILREVEPGEIATGDVLDHTGLMGFREVQRDLVTYLTGATPGNAYISRDLKNSELESFLAVLDFGILDGHELLELLDEVEITMLVPQLEPLFDGLSVLSDTLQGLFGGDLPLVGEPLRELIGRIVPAPDGLLDVLRFAEDPEPSLGDLVRALPGVEDQIDNLLAFVVTFFDRNPWLFDIVENRVPEIGQLVLPFHLSGELGTDDLPDVATRFDIGLGALGLELNGEVDVDLSFTLDFDVVLDFAALSAGELAQAVYIDTTNPGMDGAEVPELQVDLSVTTPGFGVGIGGQFGLLEVEVRDFADADDVDGANTMGFTGMFGTFTVDLHQADGKLTATDLLSANLMDSIDAELDAKADVNLLMTVDFGDSEFFPSFSTQFDLDWDFNSTTLTGNPAALLGLAPTLAFNDIELHLGTFFSRFAQPIVDRLEHTFSFLEPLTDMLDWRVPVLSDFEVIEDIFTSGSEVRLRHILAKLGMGDLVGFIDAVTGLDIATDADGIHIDFGSFAINPGVDLRTPGSLETASITTSLTNPASQLDSLTGGARRFLDAITNIPGGFRFPLLTDPMQVVNLLLGRPAELFEWGYNINEDVGIHKDTELWNIPGLPDPDIEFDGELDFNLNLAFGYDTEGLRSGDLAKGFYIRDKHDGTDKPELALGGEIDVDVDLGFGAGLRVDLNVSGGVSASIEFDLHDLDDDGKVRGDEIRRMGLDCLIEAEGRLRAGVSASLWVGIRIDPPGPGSYTKKLFSDSVSFSTKTLSFDIECEDDFQDPVLATRLANGALRLNLGTDAAHRGGDYIDGDIDESYIVTHIGGVAGDESLRVQAFGFTQDFHHVTSVFATNAKGGDDTLDLETVLSSVTLAGGNGDDVLIGGQGGATMRGGAGNDQISGGDGDDAIYGDDAGQAGNDQLSGGAGDDAIDGGSGRDLIRGEAGNDVLRGGLADAGAGEDIDDVIFGGIGDDEIYGDAGHDSLEGEEGDDLVHGGGDDDIISWQLGDGVDTTDGGEGSDQLTVTGSDGGDTFGISRDGAFVVVNLNGHEVAALSIEVTNLELGQSDDADGNPLPDGGRDTVLLSATGAVDVLTLSALDGVVHVDGLGTHVALLGSSFSLDTLTVDAGAGNDTINAGPSEFDANGVTDALIALRLLGGAGNDRVIGSALADFIDSGSGDDHVTGGLGVDVFVDGSGRDTIDESRNSGFTLSDTTLTIGAETEALNRQFEEAVLTGGASANAFTVRNWTGRAWLDGRGSGDSYRVELTGVGNGETTIADTGASGADAVTVIGTQDADAFTFNANTVEMGDATEKVHYFGVETLVVNSLGGGDAFRLNDNGAATTINAGEGDDRFTIGTPVDEDGIPAGPRVPGVSFATVINGEGGSDDFQVNRNVAALSLSGGPGNDSFTVNLSLDAAGNHAVNGLLSIDGGDDFDTLVVNGTRAADTFTLTSAGISGSGLNLTYVNLENLAVNGRRGNDSFNVQGTNAALPTTVDGGLDDDTFNVGSLAPAAGGTVDLIAGYLEVLGADGADTMNVDDTGDGDNENGTLTARHVAGLGLGSAGIDYSALEHLNIDLGSGSDYFTLLSTHTGDTRVRSGRGSDTVVVETLDGATRMDGQGDSDTVIGPDVDNIWRVTEDDGGAVIGRYPFTFASFENLIGGTRDDRFVFSDGAGVGGRIDGDDGGMDSGVDILDYAAYTTGVNVDLTAGTASNAPGGVARVEHLIGGAGDDSLTGDGRFNIIIGRQGGDTIEGMGDHDLLLGDLGTIDDGTHAVHFELGAGGDDRLSGGAGDDRMFGQEGGDFMAGGDGDDDMTGGHNSAAGEDGGDEMHGGAGADVMLGDNGWIGPAREVTRFDELGAGDDTMDGGDGADRMWGQRGADTMDGGEGDDDMIGGLGADTMRGGAGIDIMLGDNGAISAAREPVLSDDVGRTGGDDIMDGGDGADQMVGGLGADAMAGGAGDDIMLGDVGVIDDVLLLDVAEITGEVNLELGGSGLDDAQRREILERLLGADLVLLGAGAQGGLQLVRLIGGGDDIMAGGEGDDSMYGQRGDDAMAGDAGVDFLSGGRGADRVAGGDGDDELVGDDALVDSADAAIHNVAHGLLMLPAHGAGEVIVPVMQIMPGRETDAATGLLAHVFGAGSTAYASLIPDLAHHVHMLAGNDELIGGSGNDTMVGDDLTVHSQAVRFDAVAMQRAQQLVRGLLDVTDDYSDLVHDLFGLLPDTALAYGDSPVIDAGLEFGNDRLQGDGGKDTMIGDNANFVTPRFEVPVGLADELAAFTAGAFEAADEAAHAVRDLIHLEHDLRDVVAGGEIERHVDVIRSNNDTLLGGADNDFMVGDQWVMKSVTLALTAGGWDAVVAIDGRDPDLDDAEPWHQVWLAHHLRPRAGHVDLLDVGNDVLNGGAGADLMWGDGLATTRVELRQSAEVTLAEYLAGKAPASAALAALADVMDETAYWLDGRQHRFDHDDWDWQQHHRAERLNADYMDGADDSDLIFGQAGEDALYGNAGVDWLVGGQDQDVVDGGAGADNQWNGDTNASQVREQVRARMIDWAGAFDRFGLPASPFRPLTTYGKTGEQQLVNFDYLTIQTSTTVPG